MNGYWLAHKILVTAQVLSDLLLWIWFRLWIWSQACRKFLGLMTCWTYLITYFAWLDYQTVIEHWMPENKIKFGLDSALDIKAIRSAELCWTTCICYSLFSWHSRSAVGQWDIFTNPACQLNEWMNGGKKRTIQTKCVTLKVQLSAAGLINEVVSIS